jgi:hypothetical protein
MSALPIPLAVEANNGIEGTHGTRFAEIWQQVCHRADGRHGCKSMNS